MEEQKIKKFADEYKQENFEFEGDQTQITEVLDKEIIIHNFAKLSGAYGEFAVLDASQDNKRIQFIVGSSVILGQLEKIKTDNNFPIKVIITKRHSEKSKRDYYTLS